MKKKMVEIEGEKAYPIYEITLHYTQDINDENSKYYTDKQRLPNGRVKNSTASLVMHKEEQDIDFLKQKAKESHWSNFVKVHERNNAESTGRMPIDRPELESIEIKFLQHETWCRGWFSHWTYDDGRSNDEYLASFGAYVDRMERLRKGEFCLMGAEDRWRWRGSTDDGKETEPPCRCKYCRAKGIVRIDH